MRAKGRQASQKGEKNNSAKMSDADSDHVKEMLAEGKIPKAQIARMKGVSPSLISMISKGKRRA
jgi:hypothetical protein